MRHGTLATLTLLFIITTIAFAACEGRSASPVADRSVPPEPTIAEASDGTMEPVSPGSTPVFIPTPTSTAGPPPPTLQQAREVQQHISPRSDHFSWVQRPLLSNGRLSFAAKIDDGYELTIPTQGSRKLNVTIGCDGNVCGSIVPPSGPGWRWSAKPNLFVASTYRYTDQTLTVSAKVPSAVATDSTLYICLWTGSNPNKLLGCSEGIDKE